MISEKPKRKSQKKRKELKVKSKATREGEGGVANKLGQAKRQ